MITTNKFKIKQSTSVMSRRIQIEDKLFHTLHGGMQQIKPQLSLYDNWFLGY